MIQGNEREYNKFVGVAECHVLGFNLNKEQIQAKCGYNPGFDPVYLKQNKTGDTAIDIVTYLKEVTTGNIFRLMFFMEEREEISSNGNPRYVNAKCQSSYSLVDWFQKHEHRRAYVSEAELLSFIRNWLAGSYDWYNNDPDSAKYPLRETEQLFRNNLKAINGLAEKHRSNTVGVLLGIRSTDKGEKQDVYNKAFVRGRSVTKTMAALMKGTDPKGWKDLDSDVREFLKSAEDPKFFYKHYFGDNYRFRKYEGHAQSANISAPVISQDAEIIQF